MLVGQILLFAAASCLEGAWKRKLLQSVVEMNHQEKKARRKARVCELVPHRISLLNFSYIDNSYY